MNDHAGAAPAPYSPRAGSSRLGFGAPGRHSGVGFEGGEAERFEGGEEFLDPTVVGARHCGRLPSMTCGVSYARSRTAQG